jgi:uncharacterized protein (UPF0305 family)
MEAFISPLPDDVEALKAMVATMARKANEAEAKLANAMAHQSAIEALIAHLKLQIAKLKREQYGPSAGRSRRLLLLDQMELQLEELEADAAEDDMIAEEAAAKTTTVTAFERKRPARKPFPEHLPRERVVVPAPCSTTRAIGAASTRKPISRHGPASCKPMPIAATTISIARAATPVPCSRLAASPMPDASSSSSLMS